VTTEDKLLNLEAESSQLRAKLRHTEALVEEYRDQVSKHRRTSVRYLLPVCRARKSLTLLALLEISLKVTCVSFEAQSQNIVCQLGNKLMVLVEKLPVSGKWIDS
jgi:hypothetical protein